MYLKSGVLRYLTVVTPLRTLKLDATPIYFVESRDKQRIIFERYKGICIERDKRSKVWFLNFYGRVERILSSTSGYPFSFFKKCELDFP